MHIYIDKAELADLLLKFAPEGVPVTSPRVEVEERTLEVRAGVASGSLGFRVGFVCEPGRGLHVNVTILDPAPTPQAG